MDINTSSTSSSSASSSSVASSSDPINTTASNGGGNNLFTVEQLELVRRLRRSGLTVDGVMEAFRQLDHVENELAGWTLIEQQQQQRQQQLELAQNLLFPHSHPPPPQPLTNSSIEMEMQQNIQTLLLRQAAAAAAQENVLPSNQQPLPIDCGGAGSNGGFETLKAAIHAQLQLQLQHNHMAANTTTMVHPITVPLASPASTTTTAIPIAAPSNENNHSFMPAHSLSSSTSSSVEPPPNIISPINVGMNTTDSSSARPIRSQRTPMKEITTLDDPQELDEFIQQGEEACINDMKQFIAQFSLRQTTVAMMTGVSQPYISKLLNGNHRELSLRCRKNIYSWYLNCRRHPQKLATFVHDPTTRLETNGDGELVPQRRERYVFRPLLIKILEAYFAECPFPDAQKRMEIANSCNHCLEREKRGGQLMAKEVVTPQVIANWFANKRKEVRRKSYEMEPAVVGVGVGAAGAGAVANDQGGCYSSSISTPSPTTLEPVRAPQQQKNQHHLLGNAMAEFLQQGSGGEPNMPPRPAMNQHHPVDFSALLLRSANLAAQAQMELMNRMHSCGGGGAVSGGVEKETVSAMDTSAPIE